MVSTGPARKISPVRWRLSRCLDTPHRWDHSTEIDDSTQASSSSCLGERFGFRALSRGIVVGVARAHRVHEEHGCIARAERGS